MKTIRKVLVGLIIGGAFGAKMGGYFATVLETNNQWLNIETGFLAGSFIGITVALATAFVTQWVHQGANKRRLVSNSVRLEGAS